MFDTISFIGCGNMGSAVAKACRAGAPEAELLFANRTPAKAQALADTLGGEVVTNREAAQRAGLIFLGVKPQLIQTKENVNKIVQKGIQEVRL